MHLDLFEYVWLTSFQITKKKHEEVKVLLSDDVTFPMLGKDKRGYIIYLAKPKKRNDGLISYLGLLFDPSNEVHKRFLWQTLKASAFHLSIHVAASNFEAYADWAKDKNIDLATYVVSTIEDATVRAYLKTLWTPFVNDVATANTLSYLKMKPVHLISNPTLRVMASLISRFSMGAIKGRLSDKMQKDVDDLVSALNNIEDTIQKELRKMTKTEQEGNISQTIADLAFKEKVALADVMYETLHGYGKTSEVPSLLYTDNHGSDSIFYGNDVPSENEVNENLKNALNVLHGAAKEDENQNNLMEKSLDSEISQFFSEWEAKEATQRKILESYKLLGNNTRFRSFEFPKEDLSEYIHGKALLSSPIRRVLERLRLLKNVTGEDYRHEMGLLDMQEAIQVIASKSQRTDVFVREELQTREDAWVILVDASHSLKSFAGEVRGIALCLSEVARNMFLNQNAWSLFAFNDKFYIVKDFSESYTNRVRARIGGLGHGGMTYLPDGLLLATEALKQRTEEMKILVVISDFFPSGYEDAEETLTECAKKIQRSGIGVIGIGVKSRAVKKYFRINCIVDSPFELMKKFVDAFFEFHSMA